MRRWFALEQNKTKVVHFMTAPTYYTKAKLAYIDDVV